MVRKLNNPRGFLNIRAVAEETGISPATLRIWEMRYGWPKPQRRANGYRAYDADLVAELKRLAEMLELGYQIGELLWGGEVHWPGEDVENPHQGPSREVTVAEHLPEPAAGAAARMRKDVMAALELRSVNRLHEFLQRADWELRAGDIPLAVLAPIAFGVCEQNMQANEIATADMAVLDAVAQQGERLLRRLPASGERVLLASRDDHYHAVVVVTAIALRQRGIDARISDDEDAIEITMTWGKKFKPKLQRDCSVLDCFLADSQLPWSASAASARAG